MAMSAELLLGILVLPAIIIRYQLHQEQQNPSNSTQIAQFRIQSSISSSDDQLSNFQFASKSWTGLENQAMKLTIG